MMPHTGFFQSYFLISRMAVFIVYSSILRVIVCSIKVLLPNASLLFLLFWFLFSIEMIFPFLFSYHYGGQITMPEPGIDRSVMVKASLKENLSEPIFSLPPPPNFHF